MTGLLTGRENEAVGGVYRLGKLVAATHETATYETERGDAGEPALIELNRGDTLDAEQRLNRWRETLELSHPNLMRLHAAGEFVLSGVPVIYLVTERPDESLAGVLAERALSEDEVREMLEPTLSALSYLHKNGYAHAALEPSNILAVRETLKLSSAAVERIADGAAPPDDMRKLGTVVVQALKLGEDSGPYAVREAPEPFSGIVRHCLESDPQKRWTAEQALAYLQTGAAPLSVDIQDPVRDSPATRSDRTTLPQPANAQRPTANRRRWLYGALAGVLVAAAFIGLKKKPDSPPAAPATTPSAEVAKSPAPVPEVDNSKRSPIASSSAPSPVPRAERKVAARPGDRRADGWAVVVAAYGARGPAEKRARDMAKKWPAFKLNVFEPGSEKARHLVVIGKNLSEQNAEALRQRAVASGLPRDAYIKRFAGEPE